MSHAAALLGIREPSCVSQRAIREGSPRVLRGGLLDGPFPANHQRLTANHLSLLATGHDLWSDHRAPSRNRQQLSVNGQLLLSVDRQLLSVTPLTQRFWSTFVRCHFRKCDGAASLSFARTALASCTLPALPHCVVRASVYCSPPLLSLFRVPCAISLGSVERDLSGPWPLTLHSPSSWRRSS